MLSKELVAASTTTLVLSILSEGEDYGYALIQRVNELSGGNVQWSEGMLYPVLHWMEKEDLIESEWRAADSGHRRKYYRLRQKGRKALNTEKKQWMAVHNLFTELWKPKPNGVAMALSLCAAGMAFFATGCGKGAGSTTQTSPSYNQTGPEQAMALWKKDTNAAVGKFLELDWTQRPLFSSGNILSYSEAQFAGLSASNKDTMGRPIAEELHTLKLMCIAVNNRGVNAMVLGDKATAEKCFNQLKQCGEALDGPDSLLLLKMTGREARMTATNRLAALNN